MNPPLDVETNPVSASESLRRALFLGAVFFLTMCAHYCFKAGFGGVLVKTLGALKLPWLDVADFVLTALLVATLFCVKQLHVRLSSSIVVGALALSALYTCGGMALHPDAKGNFSPSPTLLALGVCGNLLVFAGTYGIWMLLVSTAFRRSWATLTIVGLGAQLAVLVGATFAKWMAAPALMGWIPVVVGAIYLVVFALLAYGMRNFSCGGVGSAMIVNKSGVTWMHAARSVTPYVALVLLLLIVGTTYGRALNWRINAAAGNTGTAAAASGFLGNFYIYSAEVSLLLQLLITPVALGLLPTRWGLLLQPLFGIAIAASVMGASSIGGALVVMALFTSLDYTVYNSFKESLWLSVPLTTKIYHKAFAALMVPKISALLSAASILMFGASDLHVWAFTITILAIVWAVLAWTLGGASAKLEILPVTEMRPAVDRV